MRNFIIFVYMCIFAFSCASSSEWVPETVQNEKWNWCRSDLDAPEYVDQGWCFTYRSCRKRFLREKECRVERKFCAAGDIKCLKENRLDQKWLTDEPFNY